MPKKTKKKTLVEEMPVRSKKEERLFTNLLKTTQQFMQGKSFNSMTESELFQRLSYSPQHLELFREVMTNLIKQGVVEVAGGCYTCKKNHIDLVSGTLRVHPRGFGFLQPDNAELYPQDVFIPKHNVNSAVDGDKVEVEINNEVISEKGPEGKVVNILSRGRTHMAGIVREVEKYGDVVVHVPLLGTSQRVIVQPNKDETLQVGDRIVMEVIEWGTKHTDTVCRMSRHLGHISDPSCDIKAAIQEYELRAEFSKDTVAEAESFGTRVSAKDIQGREDLRDSICVTIDPDTAKDFDDAISLVKDKQGHYQLGVHIADVSHYVRSGTALDKEAQKRCNSTYFPNYCLPMLPSELSDNLCSLKPNVNRLTSSVFMHFDREGNMVDYRISRSVINSAKRFSYREAKEVLDGKKKNVHLPLLQLMVELCGLLKRKRYERGSVEFALPDLVVIVDEKGMPYKTDYVEYDVTHQLVEEFMLKANETVAAHLSKNQKNLTYRVHDVPAEENLKDFSMLAAAFGFKLSEKPTPAEIQKLFDEALETPYGPYLATSYIRRMRLAFYSADNIGHYGLSLTHYCHFTSPIRRYVDLVAHRILFGENDNRETLELIASNCSAQERISAKAESSVLVLKKLRLLEKMYKEEPKRQYSAVVTRIKAFGIYFEVMDLMLEGFLHISQLGDDYYIFDEKGMLLKGKYRGSGFAAGDKITVMLKSVDLIISESEWNMVSGGTPGRSRGENRREGGNRRIDREPRKEARKDKPEVSKKAEISKKPKSGKKPEISKKPKHATTAKPKTKPKQETTKPKRTLPKREVMSPAQILAKKKSPRPK